MVDVLLHDGAQVAVHHGGAHPAELPELGGQLAGDGHIGLGELLPDDLLNAQLVDGVDEGEEGAHRDGGHALRLQLPHHLTSLLLVQGRLHRAVVADALGDGAVQAGGDQGVGLLGLEVVQGGAALGADLHQVLKALGGDQPQAAALLLDQGVGAHRGAVGQIADLLRSGLLQGQDVPHALDDGPGGVRGGGAVLIVEQLASLLVKDGEVGKGTAHVHTNHVSHTIFTSFC